MEYVLLCHIINEGDKWAKNWPKSIRGLKFRKNENRGLKGWFLK
jgi:hypothetical protein